MKLRNRLSLYYSVIFSVLLGITLLSIYLLSARYRQEEFYQRLKDRTITTFKLLVEVEQIDHDLLQVFDKNTINSLYEEKIILFDSTGRIIYSSIDDVKIGYSTAIIDELKSDKTDEIERKEDGYEILGLNFTEKGQSYYGIAKAYDRYGKSKLNFLGWALVAVFFASLLLVVVISFYVSKVITVPVTKLSKEIEAISTQNLSNRVVEPKTNDEINFLAEKFNDLLERVEQAFRFQTHFTHHLSHELKTPLTVLVSNIERVQKEESIERWKESLNFQKEGLMEISNIIDALLDISKAETGNMSITEETIRLDELFFECAESINTQHDNAKFNLTINPNITDSSYLEVKGSARMLKIALTNLLKNAVLYSKNKTVEVFISKNGNTIITEIINDGNLIQPAEIPFLFTHFFRGSNTAHIKGFGLGLVLVSKIVALHGGAITYSSQNGANAFTLSLPLVF
jgi:two-component system, OmpR family, sensor histidine kinase ArlS